MIISKETLQAWLNKSLQLKSLKADEMSDRRMIAAEIMGNKKSGSLTTAIGQVEVKATVTERLEIKRDDLLPFVNKLTPKEKAAITWKPSINKRAYDALPEDSIIRRLTKLSYNSPTLEVNDLEIPE